MLLTNKWKDRILRQKQDIIDLSHKINAIQKDCGKLKKLLETILNEIKDRD